VQKVKKRIINTNHIKYISYPFFLKNKWQKITALVQNTKTKLKSNSLQEFIVDRYVAFVKGRKNTYKYKINHKPWQLFAINKISISKDILHLLPNEFKKSQEIATYVVDGSEIFVEKGILQHQTNFAII